MALDRFDGPRLGPLKEGFFRARYPGSITSQLERPRRPAGAGPGALCDRPDRIGRCGPAGDARVPVLAALLEGRPQPRRRQGVAARVLPGIGQEHPARAQDHRTSPGGHWLSAQNPWSRARSGRRRAPTLQPPQQRRRRPSARPRQRPGHATSASTPSQVPGRRPSTWTPGESLASTGRGCPRQSGGMARSGQVDWRWSGDRGRATIDDRGMGGVIARRGAPPDTPRTRGTIE